MKLNANIKGKIDKYFDNITPQELYEISVKKYGFQEVVENRISKLKKEIKTMKKQLEEDG